MCLEPFQNVRYPRHQPARPVNDRVRHLMSDDVVAKAGEDRLLRDVGAGIIGIRVEITKQEGVAVAVIKGVFTAKGMGKQPQAMPSSTEPESGYDRRQGHDHPNGKRDSPALKARRRLIHSGSVELIPAELPR